CTTTSTRDLTVTNTDAGTAASVIWVRSLTGTPATNVTVRNCVLVGNSTATTRCGLGLGGTTPLSLATAAAVNTTFENNDVRKAKYGIVSQGVSAATKNTGTNISMNLVNAVSPNNVGDAGILVGYEDGTIISCNRVANLVAAASTDALGISVGAAIAISNTSNTSEDVTNASITKNRIDLLSPASTWSVAGIWVGGVASGTTLVANNMISRLNTNGTSGDMAMGIFAGGVAGSTTNIFYNTVDMNSPNLTTGGGYPSLALALGGTGTNVVNVKNNIITSTGTTGANLNRAIGLAWTLPAANLSCDFNDLFVSGTGAAIAQSGTLGTGATAHTTLANWQAASGKDANSKNVAPVYTAFPDLHLDATNGSNISNLLSSGTVVSVTDDIDCEARTATPSMGADQTAPVCLPPSGTRTVVSAGCSTYGISVSVTGTGDSPGGFVDIDIDGSVVQANATVGGSPYVFGGYANGSSHTVTLKHLGNSLCNFVMSVVTSNVSCDDGNPTTTDVCVGNVCQNNPTPCDDGNPCTINDVLVLNSATQNFDGVTAPTLPAGWVTAGTGTSNPFATNGGFFTSSPNSAKALDVTSASDWHLDSPTLNVLSASATVSFRNKFDLEATSPNFYDGAVLEISINGGAFTDIVTAGGSFTSGGYVAVITAATNALVGRNAWTGVNAGSPAFITTTANLPAATAGQPIVLRWRIGTDLSVGNTGWWIDDFSLTDVTCAGTPIAAPTASISGGGAVCSTDPLPNVVFTFTGLAPYTFTYTGPGGHTETNWPTTTYTITNAAVGTYTITALSVNGGCAGSSLGTPVSVSVQPAPNAGIDGTLNVCSTSTTNSLFAQLTGSPDGGGSWSGPSAVI
ncbi:MAG TPA: hypothetical protein VKG92_09065, partial [Flavobacteriales bacterium]|nr:hypothetical protein [Flavobacteriales bacterium]